MPRQNRVDPWSKLHAVESRGAWMGNRGILHNSDGVIVAPWRGKAWVTCSLQFRGRKRDVFQPGRYSQLFFLDEATAFAAGHRPCAECRRVRYNEFKVNWRAANPKFAGYPFVAAMDYQLHRERAVPGGGKVTYRASIDQIAPGTMIEIDDAAFLVWRDRLHRWTFSGYTETRPIPATTLTVLTPRSIVQTFRLGFAPQVHESAGR